MKLSITMMRVRTSEYNGSLRESIRIDYYKALCKGITSAYSSEGKYSPKTEEELKIHGAKKLDFNSEKDVLMGEYEGMYRFYILFSEKRRECSVVVRKK